MKRVFKLLMASLVVTAFFGLKSGAQTNLQFHYNFGQIIYEDLRNTGPLLTLEHSSSDNWGDTYFFTDFVFEKSFMSDIYLKAYRNLRFWNAPFSLHLEYNGGLNRLSPHHHAYIGGVHYGYKNPSRALFLGLSVNYRHDYKQPRPHNMYMTADWSWTSWNRVWTICGFTSLWTAPHDLSQSRVILLTEPQLWMNLNQIVGFHDNFNMSIGTEVKISYNYMAMDKFHVMPTLGVKWTFR